MIKKSILIWLSIIPLAILNGALREAVLNTWLGEKIAQPISGILLCAMVFIITLIFVPRIGKGTSKTYWKIGALWVGMTVVFEATFVLLLGGNFQQIIAMYDITTGNLWLLVVIFIGIAPWLTAKIKRII